MKAAWTMWHNTRMILLVAVCAAIYSAALLAFKTAIPLIPGFTEVRVANIFPMVFGLLFGPAGAWGTAFGNLLGDLFGGTFGPGSIGGFVGNFLLGYLPYTLWTTLVPFAETSREWRKGSWRSWTSYLLIAYISSASCAIVISTFADTLGLVPYAVLSKIITINDTLGSLIGLALFLSVYPVVKDQLGLFWPEVMGEEEIGLPLAGPLGAWLVTLGSIFGIAGGMLSDLPALAIGWISTAAILLGGLLL
ncbi:MAG: QueT transporter family protein [Desulfobacterota bacterium]|nr:QueT transporter family protein [Thermodesulfobacteriota bacterium]